LNLCVSSGWQPVIDNYQLCSTSRRVRHPSANAYTVAQVVSRLFKEHDRHPESSIDKRYICQQKLFNDCATSMPTWHRIYTVDTHYIVNSPSFPFLRRLGILSKWTRWTWSNVIMAQL